MTAEQCLRLECEMVKAYAKTALTLRKAEEFRIDEAFRYIHDIAWAENILDIQKKEEQK